jgi:hypothetical protein
MMKMVKILKMMIMKMMKRDHLNLSRKERLKQAKLSLKRPRSSLRSQLSSRKESGTLILI